MGQKHQEPKQLLINYKHSLTAAWTEQKTTNMEPMERTKTPVN